ncbi:Asp23/Gls24 family envelope stress response protein [Pullulanibacillus sp. KACC 23026]|uniref:Asp23/Gls24 family envelope stress response protein n=1 Tax=Pullulanibacillus sp. KACC 23026 TaxID=3028315 RepID=UPI0023AEF381|nr:Asp23/Gls24 family envelope stress response protein [Pullulanibacillus sp. KACC 23026]WEG11622.1 Asp23/Gls24 family envelope stress response protein [Pullulanibacillus sp. KACC 23026]
MTIELKTEFGKIDVTNDVVSKIAGGAAVDCYGIIGMASQHQLKDGLTELLGRDNFSKGVIVRESSEGYQIDMYIIVSYGTKISEIAHNVQTKVKYSLDQMLGIDVDAINIFVQGVRMMNE